MCIEHIQWDKSNIRTGEYILVNSDKLIESHEFECDYIDFELKVRMRRRRRRRKGGCGKSSR